MGQISGKEGTKQKVNISQRDIMLLTFPFSNLKGAKVRPALVIANNSYNSKFDDFLAVPLMSNLHVRDFCIGVTNEDLESGNLIVKSKLKADKMFSANKELVRMKIGKLKNEVHERVVELSCQAIK
ncbi:MAG: type II toxin-antitoxin system PemK/MazF family toxin [Thaumarchaeota archaeon]|nr:type II toxin-antitoxin system PemK/MazF family toxin [Nitrososphaerota archaeon]MDG6994412.1 type II toxin-antitoxin system PemK/MazF family toxin [Nitrososphaerota archaeon]